MTQDADYGSVEYQTLSETLTDIIFRLDDPNDDIVSLLGVATAVATLEDPDASLADTLDAEAKFDEDYAALEDSCSGGETTDSAAVESQSFKGSGDKVLKFSEGPFTVELTHSGSSNFAVYSMDTNLDDDDLLVNDIGKYKGTVLASSDENGGLRIEGDGKWTAKVTPIAGLFANPVSGDTSGTGDSVFAWEIPDRSVVTITHKGDSNFVVYSYTEDGADLLVNEIGNYTGEQVVDYGVIAVQADGKWTLSLS